MFETILPKAHGGYDASQSNGMCAPHALCSFQTCVKRSMHEKFAKIITFPIRQETSTSGVNVLLPQPTLLKAVNKACQAARWGRKKSVHCHLN